MNEKRYRWEHDSYDIVFRAQDDKNTCLISDLQSSWHADKSSSSDTVVTRFLKLNKKAFDFLGIIPLEADNTAFLRFKTSNFAGCVPLISPVTGKIYANLIVNGRFNEDVSDILPLLPDALNIEYNNDLVLLHQIKVKPPIYFECIKFIEKYLVAQRTHWRKFLNECQIQQFPSASTDWGRYAESSHSPEYMFRYPNKVNLLTTNHYEWQQINHVLSLCVAELYSQHTPRKTRLSYLERLNYLQILLKDQQIRPTQELKIHASDPIVIKDLKANGNRILESNGTEYHAWRIDFNKLFEQYVQFIMSKVSAAHNSRLYNNQKFSISGFKTNWTLSYLEPDILLKREDKLIIVDAKYKTHMLNMHSGNVEGLQEAFRHDLHQVLAYSSFDPSSQKITMLVFPATSFKRIKQVVSAPLSSVTNHVYLVGIPFGTIPGTDEAKELSMADNVKIATEGIKEILDSEFD